MIEIPFWSFRASNRWRRFGADSALPRIPPAGVTEDTGKAVMRVAAFDERRDDLLLDRAPNSA